MTLAQKETIARAYEALETISAAGAEKGLKISCNISATYGLWASIAEPTGHMFKEPFLSDLRTKSAVEVRQWEEAVLAEMNEVAGRLVAEKVQKLQSELAKLTR